MTVVAQSGPHGHSRLACALGPGFQHPSEVFRQWGVPESALRFTFGNPHEFADMPADRGGQRHGHCVANLCVLRGLTDGVAATYIPSASVATCGAGAFEPVPVWESLKSRPLTHAERARTPVMDEIVRQGRDRNVGWSRPPFGKGSLSKLLSSQVPWCLQVLRQLGSPEALLNLRRVLAELVIVYRKAPSRRSCVTTHRPLPISGGGCRVLSAKALSILTHAQIPRRIYEIVKQLNGVRDEALPWIWLRQEPARKASRLPLLQSVMKLCDA